MCGYIHRFAVTRSARRATGHRTPQPLATWSESGECVNLLSCLIPCVCDFVWLLFIVVYGTHCDVRHSFFLWVCTIREEKGGFVETGKKEEEETRKLKMLTTKPCPRCGARIEKIDGCSHMTCSGCRYEVGQSSVTSQYFLLQVQHKATILNHNMILFAPFSRSYR